MPLVHAQKRAPYMSNEDKVTASMPYYFMALKIVETYDSGFYNLHKQITLSSAEKIP